MDEFTKHHGSIHAYLEQWLETATKGNVEVTYALHVARMRLVCKVCEEQLTAPEPLGTEVSYSVQEFVKIHAHVGGHVSAPVGHVVGEGGQCWCGETHAKVKAVTADFKPVTGGFGFVPLPPSATKVLKDIGMGDIDLKSSAAAVITSQMKAYGKELAEKMTDKALAAKIAALQQTDYAGELAKGLAEMKAKGLMTPEQVGVQQENIADKKAELQALQNILTLKAMEKKRQQLLGAISGEHPTITVVAKKDKPLKIATGRKFR